MFKQKLEQTTYRGIPVNRFRSCQEWPESKASLQIDYYFTSNIKIQIN